MTKNAIIPEPETDAAKELRMTVETLPYAAPDGQFMARVGRKYLKEAGVAVFHMIGGVDAFAAWANENKGEFYTKLYPKLIDRTVEVVDLRSIEDVINDLDEESSDLVIDVDYERV